MNVANKITLSRIVLSVIIVIILLFPFELIGIDMPKYLFNGNIYMDLRYLLAGILFVIASLTDFFDGYIARKYNIVTDFGKMIDAISDKLLTNTVLVILACDGKISTIVAVIIIGRDIVVDSVKMVIGNNGKAVGAIKIAKFKTACLMIGLTLTLFYNIPFELLNLRINDFLFALASLLSVISGIKYYMMAKPYLFVK